MSDRGQPTSSSATPADHHPSETESAAPLSPPSSHGEIPLELSATENGEGDAPFRLNAPESDGADSAAAPARRKTRTVVLSVLLIVALAGLGTIGYFGWQVNTQRHTTLSTPTKISSLTLDDSEQATVTADYLQTALSAEITLTKAVGAVYTGNDEKSIFFFGGTTLLWSPESDLDTAFELVSDEQSAVSGVEQVDAGDLGGTMKCGITKSAESELAVCGWADHGSLALAMFPDRTKNEAAPLMRELRTAIQTRS